MLTIGGASAEYQIPDSAFSLRASYTHGEGNDRNLDFTSGVFQFGVVFSFGDGSLRARNQHGASLGGAQMLDMYFRMWPNRQKPPGPFATAF